MRKVRQTTSSSARFESCPRAATSIPALFFVRPYFGSTASLHALHALHILSSLAALLQQTQSPERLLRREEKVITRNRHSSIFIMRLNLCHRSSAFLSFLHDSASSSNGDKGHRGHSVFRAMFTVFLSRSSIHIAIDSRDASSCAISSRNIHRLEWRRSILRTFTIRCRGSRLASVPSTNCSSAVHRKPNARCPKKPNAVRSMAFDVGCSKVGLTIVVRTNTHRCACLSYLGADINAPDAYGYTPLMNAAMLGRLDVVRALIDSGANVQKKGQFGYTALHAAAQGGHLEVVQALVNYGASVNCKNDDGDIPLILGKPVDEW